MVLVIGNPVNLIVAQANGLSFAAYSSWMAAPAIVGSFCCCWLMYFWYRKDIDVTFTPPALNPEACLKDKRGIAFHGIVLFLTRLFLGVSDNLNAQNWVITTVAACCSLIYNFIFWPWEIKTVESEISKKQEQNGDFAPETPQKLYTQSHTSSYGGSSAIELNHVEMASPSRIHGNNFEDDTTSLKKTN